MIAVPSERKTVKLERSPGSVYVQDRLIWDELAAAALKDPGAGGAPLAVPETAADALPAPMAFTALIRTE